VREVHGHPRIDDVAMARLEFTNGAVASLTSIWHDMVNRPSLRLIEVFCENLYVRLDGTPEGELVWQFTREDTRTLQGEALAAACVDAGRADADDLVLVAGGAMFNPLNPFLAAIRDGRPSPFPMSEALAAHGLVDAIYASADRGGAVVSTT